MIDLTKYDLKYFLLLKSDGSSLYSTKDLALAELKFKKFSVDKSLMVVDNRQTFYLKQLFQTLKVIGFTGKLEHIPYEFVTLKSGAMASRAGNVVLFEDFYGSLLDSTIVETKKRHQNWPNKKIEAVAEKIALAAIKFNMLKVGNDSVIVFDIKEALSLDGFSGPYLLYMVSRINSILKKVPSRGIKSRIDYSPLDDIKEKELVLAMAKFSEKIKLALDAYEPSEIAKYLFELAQLFSAYYQAVPIIQSAVKTRNARLALIGSIKQILVNGLWLLGIETLEEM